MFSFLLILFASIKNAENHKSINLPNISFSFPQTHITW
jgi:hypothetical protein